MFSSVTPALSTWDQYWIPIVTGLVVVFIPFVVKFFNAKFAQITETAEQVALHHKDNKKALKKINQQNKKLNDQLDSALLHVLTRLDDIENIRIVDHAETMEKINGHDTA